MPIKPNSNESLFSLIKDAKTVCTEKLILRKNLPGLALPEFNTNGQDLDRIFIPLEDPGTWKIKLDSIKIIEISMEIIEITIKLGQLNIDHDDEILLLIRKLLDLLDQKVLQPLVAGPQLPLTRSITRTSDMNLQTLDALRVARQQISIRVRKFAEAGEDLSQDADYQAMQAEQDSLLVVYREQLKNNIVNSTQTDVIIIKRIGDLIAASKTVPEFKSAYRKLTHFIRTKVKNP